MYHKFINGRDQVSACLTIRAITGEWISKPSLEQILAAGWEPVPPAPEVIPEPYIPQPQSEPDIYQIMRDVKTLLAPSIKSLSDEDALAIASLFPTWESFLNKEDDQREGKLIPEDTRLWDDGKLWRCITSHHALKTWRPKDTPSLFVVVSLEEWPEIPEYIPATAPWMAGHQGTWKGEHYICKRDNTVHNPDQYPAAWEKQPSN